MPLGVGYKSTSVGKAKKNKRAKRRVRSRASSLTKMRKGKR